MRPPFFGLVTALKVLDWITNIRWSVAPHGMGCTQQICPKWEACKQSRECALSKSEHRSPADREGE